MLTMKDDDDCDIDEDDHSGGCVMEVIEGMKLTIIVISILMMTPVTMMTIRQTMTEDIDNGSDDIML